MKSIKYYTFLLDSTILVNPQQQVIYNFTNEFAIANWILNSDNGTISTTNAPYSITLVSHDSGGGSNVIQL